MTTRISIAEDADAWCRQLGNFTPVIYRPAVAPRVPAQFSFSGFESDERAPVSQARSRVQRGGVAAQFLLGGLILAAMIYPLSGFAQMQGGMGGHGGHGGRGSHAPEVATKTPDAAAAHVPSPLRAMLAEMRKLRSDLLLTSAQIGPWSAMEDALRECVELDRSRIPAAPAGGSIDAQRDVQDLADNHRQLADA